MSSDSDPQMSAIQEHASAAASEAGQALTALASLLARRERAIGTDVLGPLQHLVQGWAGAAETAVGPLAQFVDRQRELADQMADWAELQHQLADSMAAWADMQRQLANALALWLTPVGGAAHLTTRLLHELAGEPPASPPTDTDVPAQRGKSTTRRSRRPRGAKPGETGSARG